MKKIALLTWWTWNEVEVAKKSANYIASWLKDSYDIYLLPEELDSFISHKSDYNLVIPVFHGEYWEDGKIFAFLDILWLPHTFSSYDVHALWLDKFKCNIFAEKIWMHVGSQILYDWGDASIPFPVIVKPNHGGSSFFTFKVWTSEDLEKAFSEIKNNTNDQVLIQEFIVWEEVSVPIVDGEVLPIMSLQKKNYGEVFDYTSKYLDDSTIKEVFGWLDSDITETLSSMSLRLYNSLWCKGFARIDYIVRDKIPYFLEINTIPWMTEASIIPKAWASLWRTKESLIEAIIKV